METKVDGYVRALERSGMSNLDILTKLVEDAKSEAERKDLKHWAYFLTERRHKKVGNWATPMSELPDDRIKKLIRSHVESGKKDNDLFNEGVHRGITLYASVECCREESCDLCGGKNVIYSKKVIFPLQRVYRDS